MFAIINLLSARSKRFSPWWFGLKLGALVAIVIWWWVQNEDEVRKSATENRIILTVDDDAPPVPPKPVPKPKAKPKAKAVDAVETTDDLTQIEGIGPKYALVLNEAGVGSFAKLASMDVEAVKDIFRSASGRAPDPSNWIKQAAELK